MNTCPVVFFYESHQDQSAAVLIKNLLPSLTQQHFSSLGIEEPSNLSKPQTLSELKKSVKTLDGLLRISSWDQVPKVESLGYDKKASPADNLRAYKSYIKQLKKSFYSTISLLEKLEAYKIQYFGMDMPHEERQSMTAGMSDTQSLDYEVKPRNQYMLKKIKSVCHHTHEGIFVLVGVGHHHVAKDLKDSGFPVAEFFVLDSRVSPNQVIENDSGNVIAYMLRNDCAKCKQYQKLFPINVLDLNHRPLNDAGHFVLNAIGNIAKSESDNDEL